jgi:protein-S-isoprenylcysteine O-methyltransferase Ste14
LYGLAQNIDLHDRRAGRDHGADSVFAAIENAPVIAQIGPFQIFGMIPEAIGAAIYLRCAWDFALAGKGTPAPIDPPKRLVGRGLYRFVRNPMYVGVLLAPLGEAWFFRSWAILVYASIAFTWEHLFVVFYEEPALKRKFGESYSDYLARTPSWIPRFNNSAGRSGR